MMLALKTIFSSSNGITSIIFDEVDTGVSGRVAQAIAEKLLQYLLILKFYVFRIYRKWLRWPIITILLKEVEHDRTFTSLLEIDTNARIEEISRMMSGAEITDLTLQHATELLKWLMHEKTNEIAKESRNTRCFWVFFCANIYRL